MKPDSPAPRRRMAAGDRRAQLLDVAADIVLTDGFGAVTIDRVARTSSIARTVVYSQFESLDGLLAALIDRTAERMTEQITAALPPLPLEGDPDTLLMQSMLRVMAAAWADTDTWRLALVAPDSAPSGLKQLLEAHRESIRSQLYPLLAWGLERRGTPDIDVDLFTRTVLAGVEGAIRLMIDDPETYPLERISAYVTRMLGLLTSR